MRTSTFVFALTAMLWPALSLCQTPDAAERDRQIQSAATTLESRCSSDCVKMTLQCEEKGEVSRAACDTHAIACLVSCQQCSRQYPVCRRKSASDGGDHQISIMRCTAETVKCREDARKQAEGPREHITFSGGDGRTVETAVVIKGARNTFEGIMAEVYWTVRSQRGWVKSGQALLTRDNRRYDRIRNKTPDGSQVDLYFDITDFFGKM